MIRTVSGSSLAEDPHRALLVLRVGVGVEEAHHHAVHALAPDDSGEPPQPILVQRAVHGAVRPPPLRDLQPQRPLDQRLRMIEVDVVHLRPGLAADLEEVAEPVGGDQRDLAAAALDQRVGADGGAVGQAGHAGRVERVRGQHFADPVDDRPVRAFGGRRQLVQDGAVLAADRHHQIGERAADVDSDVDLSAHARSAVAPPESTLMRISAVMSIRPAVPRMPTRSVPSAPLMPGSSPFARPATDPAPPAARIAAGRCPRRRCGHRRRRRR